MRLPPQNRSFYDAALERRLRRLLAGRYDAATHGRLEEMGRLAATRIDELSAVANKNGPVLVSWDRAGNRVDEVRFDPSYDEMRRLAYGSGMIARAYESPRDPHRLVFALGLLFGMGEQGLFCPICMTDGAARVIEKFGPPDMVRRFVPRLGARERPWEGCMWLTERQGGSDVGANETRAVEEGGRWLLSGEKFFCSNLGGEVALVLARVEGAGDGTRGLGLFLVPMHLADGKRNEGVRFRRLKDKLGTRSMATGEVELERAEALLIAGPGQGFKAMAEMLNLSRLYNAVGSCAGMRRAWFEAARYAAERTAFGRRLEEHPLHQEVLADIAVETEAATAITFETIRRMDAVDGGSEDPEDSAVLRALTPLVKLHTAKKAVAAASEAIEALGGNGYVEEFPTARLFRDAQVLPVWEGTTNILALDFVFRCCGRQGAHETLAQLAEAHFCGATHPSLAEACDAGREELAAASALVAQALELGLEEGARLARKAAFAFGRTVEAALLLSEAQIDLDLDGDARGALVALRFLGKGPRLDARKYAAVVKCERIGVAEALPR